jgi:large subunit ribosomal protein L15
MQLFELKPQLKKKNKKRIGRGGKRGVTSGKGQKGQSSRAGHRIKPAEREMIQRLPKLRGFRNKPLKKKPAVINIEDLEKKIDGGLISRGTLIEAGLIRKSDKEIKILGKGELKKTFQIEGLKFSENAKKKIEAVGGNIKQST